MASYTVNARAVAHARRLHRMGLIACEYRAAEWRLKAIELAAHDLLQHLDKTSVRKAEKR